MYNILNFGMVESKNEEISLEDITGYELKCGNLRILSRISDTRGMVMNEINIPIMERNGYNDYFSEYKLNNLDKWNLTIHYNYKGDTLTETISIKNNVINVLSSSSNTLNISYSSFIFKLYSFSFTKFLVLLIKSL